MGILGGGFYFHNLSLPVIRNARDPSKVPRDLFLGYLMVFLTYWSCGVLGYYGFTGYAFRDKDPSVTQIEQNCINMFPIKSGVGTFIRLCVFLQLSTVNALLFAFERAQILLLATGRQEARTLGVNLGMNIALLFPSFLLAVYYPKVGNVAAYLGSFTTMFCIYILPIACFLKMKYDQIKPRGQST